MLGHDVGVWVEVREQRKKTKCTTKPLIDGNPGNHSHRHLWLLWLLMHYVSLVQSTTT